MDWVTRLSSPWTSPSCPGLQSIQKASWASLVVALLQTQLNSWWALPSVEPVTVLRTLGVQIFRIRSRPRPCRQQPQDHMTPSVPRAFRRKPYCPPRKQILPTPWRHCDHARTMTQAMPSQKLDAKSFWYIDGSKQVRDDGINVFVAYNATRGVSHPINPRGSGATNTITRAELAAIASLFIGQAQGEIIATDSQASICMIARYMDSPQTLQQCKHRVMLEDIVAQLLSRARKGLEIRTLKAKSYIGI